MSHLSVIDQIFLDYDFTNDEKITVLKRLVQEIPEKLSREGEWFGLSPSLIFPILQQLVEKFAEILKAYKVQENPELSDETGLFLCYLETIDKVLKNLPADSFLEERLNLARHLLNTFPQKLVQSIQSFKFDQKIRFDFAEKLLVMESEILIKKIENFNLTSLQKLAIVNFLLENDPKTSTIRTLVKNLNLFSFDEETQFDLAKKIAVRDGEVLADYIENFNLNKSQLSAIADSLLIYHPKALIGKIQSFSFDRNRLRELADQFLETNPETLIVYLQHFNLPTDVLKEYVKKFQEKTASEFLSNIQKFPLSADERFTIAKEKGLVDPENLLKNIGSFQLNDTQSNEILELLKPIAHRLQASHIENLFPHLPFSPNHHNKTFIKAAKEVLCRCEDFPFLSRLTILNSDDLLECANVFLLHSPKKFIKWISIFKIKEEQLTASQILEEESEQSFSIEENNHTSVQPTIAERLLKADPQTFLNHIDKFLLSEDMQFLVLYKLSPCYPTNVGPLIQMLCKRGEKEGGEYFHLALAYELMQKSPEAFVENIEQFHISCEDGYEAESGNEKIITTESIKGFKGDYTHDFVDHFNRCRSRKVLFQDFAETLRRKCPQILIKNVRNFHMPREWLNAFGSELEEKNPDALASNLSSLEWTESQIITCAKRLVSRMIPFASQTCIKSGRIINPENQEYLRLIELFCNPSQNLPLYNQFKADIKRNVDSGNYHLRYPVLSNLAKQVLKMEVEEKYLLLLWLSKLESLGTFKGSSFIENGREALEKIFKIHSPSLRYQLSFFLSIIFENPEYVEFLNSQRLKNVLFRLVLAPFIADDISGEEEFLERVSILNEKEYKDISFKKTVFSSCFTLLISAESLRKEEKKQLLKLLFPLEKIRTLYREKQELESNKGTKKDSSTQIEWEKRASAYKKERKKIRDTIAHGFHLIEALCQMNQWESLKTAECIEDLEAGLQRVFAKIINLGEIEGFTDKYFRSFGSSNDPTTIFTYAAKVNQIQASKEREDVLNALNTFAELVLNDSLSSFRYQELSYNDHLSTVFNGREELKASWMQGETCLFQELVVEMDPQGRTGRMDIHGFLQEKILLDGHIAKEKLPLLCAYLENRLSIQEAKNTLKNKSEERSSIDFAELGLILLLEDDKSPDLSHEMIENAFASEEQFKKDLHDLLAAISQPMDTVKQKSYEGWSVEDTDDWYSFLRCGTDVMGSCQSIHGSPNLNKALLGYALDGKNRLIVVKNKQGAIVARSVMRILWNKESRTPVLFVERTYSQPHTEEVVFKVLNRMCTRRANALSLPLLKKDNTTMGEVRYPYIIYSLNGKAPFEYVDARREITNGEYEILSSNYFTGV